MAQFLPNSCDPVSIGELRTAYKNGCDPLARFKAYVRSDSPQKLLEDTSVRFKRYEDPDSLQKLLEDTKVRFEYEDSHYTVLAPPGKLGFILSYEGGVVLGYATSNSAMKDKIPPGDQIIAVDHADVSNLTSIEIHKLLVSKAGCQRRLQIRKSIITKRVIPPRLCESKDLMTPSTCSRGYHEMESRIQYILEDQTVKDSDTVELVFHGTHHSNNASILVNGLDPAMRRCQSNGKGEYFSRDPSICIPYCKYGNSMLVFLVIDSSAKKCRMKGERIDLSCVIVEEPRHQFPFGVLHFTWVAGLRRNIINRCISLLVPCTQPPLPSPLPIQKKPTWVAGLRRNIIHRCISLLLPCTQPPLPSPLPIQKKPRRWIATVLHGRRICRSSTKAVCGRICRGGEDVEGNTTLSRPKNSITRPVNLTVVAPAGKLDIHEYTKS